MIIDLIFRIKSIFGFRKARRSHGKCQNAPQVLLSMIKQMKKDLMIEGWVHMPWTSTKYQRYKAVCADFEAYSTVQHSGIFYDARYIRNYQQWKPVLGYHASCFLCVLGSENSGEAGRRGRACEVHLIHNFPLISNVCNCLITDSRTWPPKVCVMVL